MEERYWAPCPCPPPSLPHNLDLQAEPGTLRASGGSGALGSGSAGLCPQDFDQDLTRPGSLPPTTPQPQWTCSDLLDLKLGQLLGPPCQPRVVLSVPCHPPLHNSAFLWHQALSPPISSCQPPDRLSRTAQCEPLIPESSVLLPVAHKIVSPHKRPGEDKVGVTGQ